MQTIFLTSSPFGPLDNSRTVIGLDPMNRFPEQVERYWRPQARCLVISAFPSDLKSCDPPEIPITAVTDFDGIIIGISAGTMNAADTVYAQPELAGEAVDPAYRKFLTGLGLTDINICPHYQMLKDSILDGMRLFDDITYADSRGRRFLALPDGSYVLIRDGKAEVWGEAWQIADGKLTAFCGRDESRSVPSSIY